MVSIYLRTADEPVTVIDVLVCSQPPHIVVATAVIQRGVLAQHRGLFVPAKECRMTYRETLVPGLRSPQIQKILESVLVVSPWLRSVVT